MISKIEQKLEMLRDICVEDPKEDSKSNLMALMLYEILAHLKYDGLVRDGDLLDQRQEYVDAQTPIKQGLL